MSKRIDFKRKKGTVDTIEFIVAHPASSDIESLEREITDIDTSIAYLQAQKVERQLELDAAIAVQPANPDAVKTAFLEMHVGKTKTEIIDLLEGEPWNLTQAEANQAHKDADTILKERQKIK